MTTKNDDIQFTPEQTEAINHKGEQLLVKGIAGSGKTLVLLKSAINLAQQNPKETVAVFSFGNPLSTAAQNVIAKYNLPNLTVITFHKWAHQAYSKTFGRSPDYVPKGKYYFSDAIRDLNAANATHRFFKTKDLHDFLKEEIKWIKGRNIKSEEEYLKALRKGRGSKVRLSAADRKLVYKIFTTYEAKKGSYLDYDDSAVKLVDAKNKISDSVKYDHIIIDEAQDLAKVNLELLVSISKQTCRIGADIGQKIYPTTFTWKETGLDFRGNRVKTLQQSFRSTKQIVELASSLQKKDEIVSDEEFTSPEIPAKEGAVPHLFLCKNEAVHDIAAIKYVVKLQQQSPDASIGVLVRNWESAIRLQEVLRSQNINFTEIGVAPSYKRKFKVEQGTHTSPGIKFTTFHTAKGLEFSYVVVVDLVNPPTEVRLGDEFDWDLERRLLYVAMTRAKYELALFTHDEKAKLVTELDADLYTDIEI